MFFRLKHINNFFNSIFIPLVHILEFLLAPDPLWVDYIFTSSCKKKKNSKNINDSREVFQWQNGGEYTGQTELSSPEAGRRQASRETSYKPITWDRDLRSLASWLDWLAYPKGTGYQVPSLHSTCMYRWACLHIQWSRCQRLTHTHRKKRKY